MEKQKQKLLKNTILMSGSVCLILSVLLILNGFQLFIHNPLPKQSLNELAIRLNEFNNPALLSEVRNLDVLAHKAFLCSTDQIKVCTFLLLLGGLIFAVAWYKRGSINSFLLKKWIVRTGILVFMIAFYSSFMSAGYFEMYSSERYMLKSAEFIEDGKIHGQKNAHANTVATVYLPEENVPVDSLVNSNNFKAEMLSLPLRDSFESEVNLVEINASGESESSVTEIEQIINNHNCFRGPWGNGISYHKNIPVDWDGTTGKNLLWKTEISKHGYNSPVIWEEKLFISGADAETREVYCFDINSGTLLWTKKAEQIPGSPEKAPKVDENTGLAASSVTTNGRSVFAIFGTGDVIALDMNGKRIWARNIGVPELPYGYASSLVTWADKLFVQFDTNSGAKLMALDTESGKTKWETLRNIKQPSWSSPVLANIGGILQIVLAVNPSVAGYEAETGKELWEVDCMAGEVTPSVAIGDNQVFAAMEYAQIVAIDPTSQSVIWEDNTYLPEIASPVVSDGLLVVATTYGDLACYDSQTGTIKWETYYDDSFYSSPVIAENKIYAMGTSGVMYILELNPELNEIGTPELGEACYSTPAFSQNRIYIRGNSFLYCFGK